MRVVRLLRWYLVAVGLVVLASAAWITVEVLMDSLGFGLALFVGALIQLAVAAIAYGVYVWLR